MAVGEWDQRQLCPDGSCIGVIGPDGTCKVCGRAAPNWGDERNRGLITPPDDGAEGDGQDEDDEDDDELAADGGHDDDDYDEDEDDGDAAGAAGAAGPAGAAQDGAPRGEWAVRRLCPNGACIGVIGPDGRCKVCGRRDTEAPDAAADAPASEPADAPASEPADAPADAPASEPAEPPAPTGAASAAEPAAGDREPCTTPGCDGHIGADGRCAVCGKGVS
ncbi:MAG TPA: hypothetical protein VHW23_12995 [Kofleriaceae bacterium]|jgi:hypothetical protein|nr:hypothetical protein [Kofleriaceae bacterium]